ncbi:MAG: hypothetical protein HY671_04130 [Chloroflexi bacterium]|nr:hypothetical protein [Chloroflexota bacterium]
MAWWQRNYWFQWYADPGIAADAQAAVAKWKELIPGLPWYPDPIADEAGSNVRVYYQACPDGLGAPSCYKVIDTFNPPTGEQAAYVNGAAIYIDPDTNLQWLSSARMLAIAHELGQFYGLHERNLTSPASCNPDELTIMDMLQVTNGQGFPLRRNRRPYHPGQMARRRFLERRRSVAR